MKMIIGLVWRQPTLTKGEPIDSQTGSKSNQDISQAVIRGFPKTTKSARISTTAISSVRYRRKGVGFCAMNAAGPPALQMTSVPIFKGASHSCEPARRCCQRLGAPARRTSLKDKASVVASIKSAVSPQIPVASHTRISSIAVSRCC